ncbi:MAG: caspase family protein, partial [Myxococcota bacterium]
MNTRRRLLLRLALIPTLIVFFIPAAVRSARQPVQRLALVIGVSDGGPERTRLRYATSDARAVSRVLSELGGLDEEDTIVLEEPDLAQFGTAFADFASRARAAKQAGHRVEALLYYSGHSNETGLLFGERVYEYQSLRRAFGALAADVRVAIVDSCSSGALTRSKGGRKSAPLVLDESASVKGSAILTSASATESAQESDSIGGSFFTH